MPKYFEEMSLASFRNIRFSLVEGQPYGTFVGLNTVTDENGNLVIYSNGTYITSFLSKPINNINSKWTGGITNIFTYKNYTLSGLIDVHIGGSFYSTTQMFGRYSGVLEETAGENDKGNPKRDPVSEGGGIRYENTVVGYVDITTGELVITDEINDNYYDTRTWSREYYDGPGALNIIPANYVKLREVTLCYTIDGIDIKKVQIQTFKISLFGRNLALWGTKTPHVDPEHVISSNNIQGFEGAALPAVRSYGFIISANF